MKVRARALKPQLDAMLDGWLEEHATTAMEIVLTAQEEYSLRLELWHPSAVNQRAKLSSRLLSYRDCPIIIEEH